jgi:putative aminopeptidase FrvX
MEQLISILKDLTQIAAPSGYEKGVAEYIKDAPHHMLQKSR